MATYGISKVVNSGGKVIIDPFQPLLRVFAKGTILTTQGTVHALSVPSGCRAPMLFLRTTAGWGAEFFVGPTALNATVLRFATSNPATFNVDWAICGVQTDTDPGAQYASVWRRPGSGGVVTFSSAYEYMRLWSLPTGGGVDAYSPNIATRWNMTISPDFSLDDYYFFAPSQRWDLNASFAYYASMGVINSSQIFSTRFVFSRSAGIGEIQDGPVPEFMPSSGPIQKMVLRGRLVSG